MKRGPPGAESLCAFSMESKLSSHVVFVCLFEWTPSHTKENSFPIIRDLTSYPGTPRSYLTLIVGTDHSVLADWQQYKPIGAVWLLPNGLECRCNFRVLHTRLQYGLTANYTAVHPGLKGPRVSDLCHSIHYDNNLDKNKHCYILGWFNPYTKYWLFVNATDEQKQAG